MTLCELVFFTRDVFGSVLRLDPVPLRGDEPRKFIFGHNREPSQEVWEPNLGDEGESSV